MLAARSGVQLSDRQRLSWLRLIRSENVGPATFRVLVNQFGGAEAALEALPALSRRGGRASIRVFTEAEAEAELEAADRAGARLVVMGEKGYPPALSHVDAPPPLLYAKGRLDLADAPIVAMVGARNGSAVGQKLTRQLATELGLEGFVIASGLARGIDTAAHLAALERGTIAVLAGGIDVVYPPENTDLQRASKLWRRFSGAPSSRSALSSPLLRKGYRLNPCPRSRKASGSGSSARSGRARSISTRSPGSPASRCARCTSFSWSSISRESCRDTDSSLCH
jgi:DNA recombination-mediator protein A/DprA/Smf-like nucleotide binding protein involved in DNA uptake